MSVHPGDYIGGHTGIEPRNDSTNGIKQASLSH